MVEMDLVYIMVVVVVQLMVMMVQMVVVMVVQRMIVAHVVHMVWMQWVCMHVIEWINLVRGRWNMRVTHTRWFPPDVGIFHHGDVVRNNHEKERTIGY
jgi:hypothetical protein